MGLHGENSSIHALVEALHDPELYGLSPPLWFLILLSDIMVSESSKRRRRLYLLFSILCQLFICLCYSLAIFYLAVTLTGSIFLMNYHTLVTMTAPAVTAGQTEYP